MVMRRSFRSNVGASLSLLVRQEGFAIVWGVLNIIGTIAFAVSGSLVAIEEQFDLLGVFILGFVTAFGGGMIRNLIVGLPVANIWHQPSLFLTATITICIVFVLPYEWMHRWQRIVSFFDAIGLSAFAIEGATYAHHVHSTFATTLVAGLMTGIGGGIIRDVLAGRKPLVFQSEIYAVWALFAGLCVGLGIVPVAPAQYALFVVVVVLRMISLHYGWHLPKKWTPATGEHINHDA
nr:trimeric intracellular cation channel family protein [Alicyclobacillus hesperidum]